MPTPSLSGSNVQATESLPKEQLSFEFLFYNEEMKLLAC